jgi:hypothetical protein
MTFLRIKVNVVLRPGDVEWLYFCFFVRRRVTAFAEADGEAEDEDEDEAANYSAEWDVEGEGEEW